MWWYEKLHTMKLSRQFIRWSQYAVLMWWDSEMPSNPQPPDEGTDSETNSDWTIGIATWFVFETFFCTTFDSFL